MLWVTVNPAKAKSLCVHSFIQMIWGTFLYGQASVTGWQVGMRRSVEFDDGDVVAWTHLEIIIIVIDEYGTVEFCANDGGVVFLACGLDEPFLGYWGGNLYLLFQVGNKGNHHHRYLQILEQDFRDSFRQNLLLLGQ